MDLAGESTALRCRLAKELKRDVARVEQTEPTTLGAARERQEVLKDVTQNAKVLYAWDSERPVFAVNLQYLAGGRVATPEELRTLPPSPVGGEGKSPLLLPSYGTTGLGDGEAEKKPD